MTSPMMTFGMHKGRTVDQLPDDYVRWLASPDRETPVPGRHHRPLPADVVAAARGRLKSIEERKARQDFSRLCLGGHPTGVQDPVYVIECDGDCHSKSGSYAIDNQWFGSLDKALAYLAEEFPIDTTEDLGGEAYTRRSTPDPEDDLIIVWEVIPSGHRKAVWAFMGWHHSHTSETLACGQGSLPGDEASLYDQAVRDY